MKLEGTSDYSRKERPVNAHCPAPSVSNSGIANMFNNHPQSQQATQQRRESTGMLEDPLGLIVRSRMSMSVMFDCVWRWREAQVSGASDQLDNTVVTNPTNPDSSSSSTPPPGTIVENPAHTMPNFNPHLNFIQIHAYSPVYYDDEYR